MFLELTIFSSVFNGGVWRSLVSAPALGAGGRRFESSHPDGIDYLMDEMVEILKRSWFYHAPVAQLDRATDF